MPGSKIRTLVVVAHYPERLSYFADWLDAFVADPALDVMPANLVTPLGRRRVRRHARDADLVVLLHSAIGDSLTEIGRCAGALEDRRGSLVAFVGNEVSLPGQPLRAKVDLLRTLAPEVIGTQLPIDAASALYADVPGAKVIPMPHALNPAQFFPTVPNDERPIDVGFRGGKYPASLGEHDRDRIVDYFATTKFGLPLAIDARIDSSYGRRGWSGFLNRCKATIGAESGVRELRLEMPDVDAEAASSMRARLRPAHRYLPRPIKTALRRGASRLTPAAVPLVAHDVVGGSDDAGSLVSGKCLSSRHFDAIGTETCQILFPGRYNDLLVADRHYLELARDYSNIDDVLARFSDVPYRLQLVRDARAWALASETYAHRVRSLLQALGMS